MGNVFNGKYEVDKTKKRDLSDAHKDALELLEVVHRICDENHWVYTLIGNALLCQVYGKDFAELRPNIEIAMPYDMFTGFRQKLKELADRESHKYVMADHRNSKQFDSVALWFAKRNRVVLPEYRKQDEIYYYIHVTIIPVFYAGNRQAEYNKIFRYYSETMKILNARAALPQRTLLTRIRIIKRIIRDAYYRPKRGQIHFPEFEETLGKMYSASDSSLYFIPGYSSKPVERREAEDIMPAEFAGRKCMVSRYAESLLCKCFEPDKIAEVLRYQVSDLILKGGETLRRVQKVQTEMLVEFDRVCRKNDIRYHIAFGTLLGAVRHKGFIPWDDDVDVILPYEDYCKLDAAMEKDLDTGRFFWRTIDTEVDFNLTFKHLKRNNTVYKKPGRDRFRFHEGVLIDVFPVFPSANRRILHWIQTRLCVFFRRATWAYMGIDSEQNPIKKFIFKQMNKRGVRKNYESFLKCATLFKKRNSYYSYYNANFRSPYHTYYLSDKAFDETVEYEFEGHKFLGPKNYDAAMTYCFGKDYMLFPQPNLRQPSHFAIIELGDLYSFDGKTTE